MNNVVKLRFDKNAPEDVDKARRLGTHILKRMWVDGSNGVSYEAIHYVLHERGHGDWCAI